MTLKDIPQETPRTWKDFQLFYERLLQSAGIKISEIDFLKLPFEMQFGVYVSFFRESGLDVDVPQWDMEVLKVTICETFRLHENMMGHFS
jgi:hypothetical protein